jgi:hypothetical protein
LGPGGRSGELDRQRRAARTCWRDPFWPYGNAIDINPAQNPFRGNRTDMPPNISDLAAKHGLIWGGDWRPGSRDPMHFEWTGAGEQKQQAKE